jgi:hypothetical protein
MLRRASSVIALLALVTVSVPSLAQEALKQGALISGKLRFFRHQHPNGTWINVYQITADHPRVIADKDEFCPDTPPATFHLVVMDDRTKKARLDRQLGKTVAVVAEVFFCSETAWHVGDAVVTKWHFVESGRP